MANSTGRRSGGGGRVSLLGDCGRGSPTVSARSGGSGKTTHTLAAMSAGSNTSAVSMHPNSYSYLSDRVYDYGQAESMWMERVQDERRGQGRETIALKRLPSNFDPFFVSDGLKREQGMQQPNQGVYANLEAGNATTEASNQTSASPNDSSVGFLFRTAYTGFSSRAWDRLYLYFGLLWAMLCPIYLDGLVVSLERQHLAWVLLAMCGLAITPPTSVVLFKACFSSKLRPCVRQSKHSAGVFFILATKCIPVVAIPFPKDVCGKTVGGEKVHPDGNRNPQKQFRGQGIDVEASNGRTEVGPSNQHSGSSFTAHSNGQSVLQSGPAFGGLSPREKSTTTTGKDSHELIGQAGFGSNSGVGTSTQNLEEKWRGPGLELELPPRHWRCIVCKKVNVLPASWDGRAGKAHHVVIKRKVVDTKAMYGVFKTTPDVPKCHKCKTPFNYSFRSGNDATNNDNNNNNNIFQQNTNRDTNSRRGPDIEDPPSSSPSPSSSSPSSSSSSSSSSSFSSRQNLRSSTTIRSVPEEAPPPEATTSAVATALSTSYKGRASGGGLLSMTPSIPLRRRVKRWIRRLKQRYRTFVEGAGDAGKQDFELWYGREFHRQLKTFFKPELPRPVLLHGQSGRYPVGARVACFAGKEAWYPGTIEASRENNTYDVRYDNGDIAQHVFPHMVRFEPIHSGDSRLVCLFYGLALVAAVLWPMTGYYYWSTIPTATAATTSDEETMDFNRGAMVAAPAFALGVVGVVGVTIQFWAIYDGNRSAGVWVTARYAGVIAATPAALALVGGSALIKAANPSTSGTWVEMLLLPAILLTLTGGGYAHAVAPAYGKAWAAASLPWLTFLLLVCLRLDGEVGDSRPAFGRMRWLGVFFPLWILLCMIIAAHHVLPLVWDVEGYPEPANLPPWLIRLGSMVKERQLMMESRIREAINKRRQALIREDSGGRGNTATLEVEKEEGGEDADGDYERGEGVGDKETSEKNA